MPFAAYTDSRVFAREARRIFLSDWVFVCMAGELPSSGDYYAITIAGEPVVVVRCEDGQLRAKSNVCRHRGTPLLDDGAGNTGRQIVCPYHAWSYGLDGDLKGVPFNENVTVDPAEHRLIDFQLEVWNGLVFVRLTKDEATLADRLAGIDQYLGAFEPGSFDTALSGSSDTWSANWKLVVENAIESYHLFKVHRDTLEKYTPTRQAFYIAGSSEWSLTGGVAKREGGLLTRLFSGGYDPIYDNYVLVSIPPSFVGVLGYGSMGWLSALPVDAATTLIRSGTIGKQGLLDDGSDAAAFTDAFFAEDKQICERVQRGMSSTRACGGKLVDMERVVVDFHQYYATRLFALPGTPLFEGHAAARFRTSY